MGDPVERAYGRVLVDDAGKEVAFTDATREASDTRLAPGESRVETIEIGSASAKELFAEVLWRALSPTLAERYPTAQLEQRLLELRIAVGAKGAASPTRDPVSPRR